MDDDCCEQTTNGLVALFVAISPRSLLEIRVEIEKTLNFEPATSFSNRPLSGATSADNSYGNVLDIASNPPMSGSTKGFVLFQFPSKLPPCILAPLKIRILPFRLLTKQNFWRQWMKNSKKWNRNLNWLPRS